jgi:V/A-type H+-transporting ATPase subunit K
MNKKILTIAALLICVTAAGVFAQSASTAETVPAAAPVATTTAPAAQASSVSAAGMKAIAAGLAVGLACIGAGMAVGKIGAAAVGAMSENPEVSGKSLPFIGLAEGICLWGFLVALLVIIL